MKILGIAGYSGAGKTTLIEALLPRLLATGLRVSVVKQSHHDIDLDTATLIANEFGYQIESTAFREDQVLADSEVEEAPEDLLPQIGRAHV